MVRGEVGWVGGGVSWGCGGGRVVGGVGVGEMWGGWGGVRVGIG